MTTQGHKGAIPVTEEEQAYSFPVNISRLFMEGINGVLKHRGLLRLEHTNTDTLKYNVIDEDQAIGTLIVPGSCLEEMTFKDIVLHYADEVMELTKKENDGD